MKQLEKPIGKPLKECKCLNEFITNFLKRFLNDQRLNRDNFINNQVVTINGKKYKPKGIDHEAQDEAITELWYEYKHELYEGILSIGHHPDCELVLDVKRRLKDDQYAISNKISKMAKEGFVEEISERRREIFSLLNGSVFDVMKVKAFYKTIYYYTRLIELFDNKEQNITFSTKPKGLTWSAIGYFLFLLKGEDDIDTSKYCNESFPKYFNFEISDLVRQNCIKPDSGLIELRILEIEKYVYPHVSNDIIELVSSKHKSLCIKTY